MIRPRILVSTLAAGAVLVALVSAILAEGALHIPKPQRVAPAANLAESIAQATNATWREVQIAASDQTILRAWIFLPRRANGGGVVLLHGVADSRAGVLSQAEFLLQCGYTVLTPDSRGHGASGGETITYGLLEREDLHHWLGLLTAQSGIQRVYALGVSMGAGVLLQALPGEPRLRAVVADCPFATFPGIARDRIHQASGLPPPLAAPFAEVGLCYARLRYGLDLHNASPAAALSGVRTPILLIHGDRDRNIPPRHSRQLHAANPATEIWIVPGADHAASLLTVPQQYRNRVITWFASH